MHYWEHGKKEFAQHSSTKGLHQEFEIALELRLPINYYLEENDLYQANNQYI